MLTISLDIRLQQKLLRIETDVRELPNEQQQHDLVDRKKKKKCSENTCIGKRVKRVRHRQNNY